MIAANISSYPFAVLMTYLFIHIFEHSPQGETPFYFIIWISFCFFVILRYYFLSLTPELISRYLISNISESIILLDDDLKIYLINKKTEELLGESKDKIINLDLSNVVLKYDLIKNEIDKLLKYQHNDFSCRLYFKSTGVPVLMDLKFSKVNDNFNDLLGILIIGSEVKELKQLKFFFKLSEREVEIVQLMMEGLSNKEIGADTKLTENTIKTHIKNIFKKLKVKGRVEMINLLTEYNLIPRTFSKKKILSTQ